MNPFNNSSSSSAIASVSFIILVGFTLKEVSYSILKASDTPLDV
jgi:hypothetical protein